MRMAAGPSSLAETPEALLSPVRQGGLRGAAPAEPAGGGRLPAARDRQVGEPAQWDAAAIPALTVRQRRCGCRSRRRSKQELVLRLGLCFGSLSVLLRKLYKLTVALLPIVIILLTVFRSEGLPHKAAMCEKNSAGEPFGVHLI